MDLLFFSIDAMLVEHLRVTGASLMQCERRIASDFCEYGSRRYSMKGHLVSFFFRDIV